MKKQGLPADFGLAPPTSHHLCRGLTLKSALAQRNTDANGGDPCFKST
jgi:hypothetical protein